MKKPVRSQWSQHLAFVALEVLGDNDGKMLLADLLDAVEKRAGKDIPEDKKLSYASGAVKWKNKLQFECIAFVRAGFLRKTGGFWLLTEEGKKILKQGKARVLSHAKAAVREAQQKKQAVPEPLADDAADTDAPSPDSVIETYQSTATRRIKEHIDSMDGYAFQDLCEALLLGMGYHVRNRMKRGPDGGIDIVAYTDPLGGSPPRLKVQVKHRQKNKIGKPVLDQLAGKLRDGDIGVVIASGGFAAGCDDYARDNDKHLELIDMERFIDLWREYYDKLSEEDKARLPLLAICFLDEKRALDE